MAFRAIDNLGAEVVSALGGNRKNGEANPVTITGYFFGSLRKPSKMNRSGFQMQHLFKTETKLVGIWGSKDLDEKMALVTRGHKTRVTFKESKTTKSGTPFKIFLVEEDPDDKIIPPPLPVQPKELAPDAQSYSREFSDANEDIPF